MCALQICAVCIVGFGMNGKEYNGSSRKSLITFNQVRLLLPR
jgi:hypothetical protein